MVFNRRTFHIVKTFIVRHKWTSVLTLIWIVALLQLTFKTEAWKPKLQRNMTVRDAVPKRYDVVLNSYMRGGSTLTGLVLGHRSDSYYVYEPLWKIARWVYWRGNDTVCRTDGTECRKYSPDESPDPKFMKNLVPSYTGSLRLAQKILYKIYDCQFNGFYNLVVHPSVTVNLGGPSWSTTKSCSDRGGNLMSCVNQHLPRICKNATHRVTKVLRVTLDNLEALLQSRDNVKIIHLFRDPRAIINSRIETSWYPSKQTAEILSNAESLCKKMIYDFHEGKKLSMKYPERFKFLLYEDLNDDPLDKVKTIYKYLGMSLDQSKYSIIKSIKVFDKTKSKVKTEREKNTAFWWRKTLDWQLVAKIDRMCKDVYDALGYVTFSTHDDLTNLTLKSVHIAPKYALM